MSKNGDLVRFDCFEVDRGTGRLLRRGLKVNLREQSFQVLCALLERPGELVTRDDLCRLLWRNEVFVDFDNNLNAVVAHLRERLGDSAEHPRFIETLPKHGYRFIAKVLDGDLGRLPTVSTVAAMAPRSTGSGWILRAVLGAAALLMALVALNVGGLRNRFLGRSGPPRIESLAVLPLANISHDPEQEYFADGMTDALITELAKISALKVISRTSVMRYKKTDKTVPEIAAELNVDGLLEGTVEREGDQVRINVQLIHGPTDKHLWAESYQRRLPDILSLESEVAQAIAKEVSASLTPEEHTRLVQTRPIDPQVHEAYLKGRYFLNMRTGDGLQKALGHFETAIRIDPTYALAYTGLADTYFILGDHNFVASDESLPKARAAVQRALELDENAAEAHAAMAAILRAYCDSVGAEREINRAIQLNPGYADAHHTRALFLSQMGRHTEALAEITKARSLDPLSHRINANVGGVVLYEARQYEQAIQELRKALEVYPNDATVHLFLGRTFSAVGRHEEAIAEIQHSLTLQDSPVGRLELARILARAGKRQQAKKLIQDVLNTREENLPSPAAAYAALGDKDQAFASLAKEYPCRWGWPNTPAFDPLRSDPRFAALLRRTSLTP